MEKQIELLINEFGEIPDNNWEQERSAAESRLGDRVNSYPGVPPLTWKVVAKNIGRGADWWVLSLCFIGAGIVVPKMHKEIREGIDEWQRIYKELQRFFDWILEGKKPLYPDEYLFLKSGGLVSIFG